ncbi:MAG: hypothetical protein QHJ82_01700 [Verrucomicrobiota bacterium]|nr:hypothetical protein [Verrucomicrobiota bacterium]
MKRMIVARGKKIDSTKTKGPNVKRPIPIPDVLIGVLALCMVAGLRVSAAVFAYNDFSASASGNYDGTKGQALGADPELGNATGLRFNIQVQNTGGVGNSPMLLHADDVAMRAREAFDIASTTYPAVRFSLYFRFDPAETLLGGFIGMGWALSSATDNRSPWNQGNDDRVLVGLRRTDNANNTVRVSSGGQFQNFATGTDIPASYFDTPSANLTLANWYQMSFDLTFNYDSATPANSTWALANFVLRDWGADGQTGGSTLIKQASSYTWNPAFGINLDSSHNAYAYIAGNGDRGVQRVDNVLVQTIPEPSAIGTVLTALASAAVISLRRSPRRA